MLSSPIDEIRKRHEEAVQAVEDERGSLSPSAGGVLLDTLYFEFYGDGFVRDDIATLLAEIERLRSENARLRAGVVELEVEKLPKWKPTITADTRCGNDEPDEKRAWADMAAKARRKWVEDESVPNNG